MKGKDLYVEIASIAMHVPYKKCLEHFPKNCPIKKNEEGKWEYALRKDLNDDGKNEFEEFNKEMNEAVKLYVDELEKIIDTSYNKNEAKHEDLDKTMDKLRNNENHADEVFNKIKKNIANK